MRSAGVVREGNSLANIRAGRGLHPHDLEIGPVALSQPAQRRALSRFRVHVVSGISELLLKDPLPAGLVPARRTNAALAPPPGLSRTEGDGQPFAPPHGAPAPPSADQLLNHTPRSQFHCHCLDATYRAKVAKPPQFPRLQNESNRSCSTC